MSKAGIMEAESLGNYPVSLKTLSRGKTLFCSLSASIYLPYLTINPGTYNHVPMEAAAVPPSKSVEEWRTMGPSYITVLETICLINRNVKCGRYF